MVEDYQEQQRKKIARVRSAMDFTMGALLLLIGIFFLVYRFFGIRIVGQPPSAIDYVIGVLFAFYGGWRIYRGYKKNYFR